MTDHGDGPGSQASAQPDPPSGVRHGHRQRLVVGDLLRTLRRRLDLSQRELADRLDTSQSLVAAWETGERDMQVGQLITACALAGWRPVLIDRKGGFVPILDSHGLIRDRGYRLFPAHLDVEIHHPERLVWRGDLDLPPVGAPRRPRRDALREEGGAAPGHPTVDEVAEHLRRRKAELRAEREARSAAIRSRLKPTVWEDCTCLIDCEETIVCGADCPCQCVCAA
ncbi:hypothetical protein CGZ93_04205 [Enemella dayhoffiae]|uniref:HTH cro/C1-type domain-containing protein n=1 Tax=Enemella dayhoffiae TaxID=2016507 RepID=A0A255H9I4_9ACTN|nr:helix-turn-helix transcriptional regulator [Enemella dayhoffiae]OYO24311.1 hypothetical protein CGZ93_04205 [Enemella dayhoffiae]